MISAMEQKKLDDYFNRINNCKTVSEVNKIARMKPFGSDDTEANNKFNNEIRKKKEKIKEYMSFHGDLNQDAKKSRFNFVKENDANKSGPRDAYQSNSKPLDAEDKNLPKRVIEEIFKTPMVKKSDVVHGFVQQGYNRTYVYDVIKDLENQGILYDEGGKWVKLSQETHDFLKKNNGKFPVKS